MQFLVEINTVQVTLSPSLVSRGRSSVPGSGMGTEQFVPFSFLQTLLAPVGLHHRCAKDPAKVPFVVQSLQHQPW